MTADRTDNPTLAKRRALDVPIRPTRAEVRLNALRHNFDEVRQLVGPKVETLAVVKANAYGHGSTSVAHTLVAAGARFLGVALIEEGLELRHAGIRAPILVLGGSYAGGYDALVANALTPVVYRPEHLQGVSDAAERAGVASVPVHLKIDTGMGRIGVVPDELPEFLDKLVKVPRLELEGVASHFANADLADAELTQVQVERFKAALALIRGRGFTPRFRHLANSAGVMDRPDVRDGLELNLVRPGLMLYGVSPAPSLAAKLSLQPVLQWKTGITHLKRVPVGTPISYGSTWVAQRPSDIATLPIGYADGYNRHYSSKAFVLVRGKRAPIVGRVCMDMCMIDVTDIPGVSMGDEVVLLGSQGDETVSAEELATLSHTISYEVLCAVGARVPRVQVETP